MREPYLQLDGVGPAVPQLSCCSSPAYSWTRSRRGCNQEIKAMHAHDAKFLNKGGSSLKSIDDVNHQV